MARAEDRCGYQPCSRFCWPSSINCSLAAGYIVASCSVVLLPWLVIFVRRLHDKHRTGSCLLLSLVSILVFANMFTVGRTLCASVGGGCP